MAYDRKRRVDPRDLGARDRVGAAVSSSDAGTSTMIGLGRWHGTLVGAIVLLLASGCGLTGNGTDPADMSAAEHREVAHRLYEESRGHEGRDDSKESAARRPVRGRLITPDYGPYRPGDFDYWWDGGSYDPTVRRLERADEQERRARDHLRAAKKLEGFEEAQCRSFPPEIRSYCPLQGQVVSASNIPNGVRVSFAEGVNMNAVIAHMRCHMAFALAQGREGMDECPLYLEGIEVERSGRGREVDLTAESASVVRALRQRTQEHLPSSQPD